MGQSADALSRPGRPGADDDSRDLDATPETAHLRRDIEHTRTDMGSTLDAIQERLNPETLGEQAKDTASDITAQAKEAALEVLDHALQEAKVQAKDVIQEARVAARGAVEEATAQAQAAVRGATIGKVETMVRSANETTNAARYGLVETIKANPFPAALTGLGLGWLFINSRSAAARGPVAPRAHEAAYRERRSSPPSAPSAYGDDRGYPERGDDAPGGRNPLGSAVDRTQAATGDVASQAGDLAGRAGDAVGDAVGQVGATASSLAGQVGETAGHLVGQVEETAGNLASGTRETAGTIAEQAQYQALRLEDTFQRVLRENPLAVGAATLALGTAVGLALPRTERENRLLGEARDTLVDKAQALAQETLEKVGHVAEEAQGAVQQEAQKQGLTP